jgi:hypothetical protein
MGGVRFYSHGKGATERERMSFRRNRGVCRRGGS